MFTGNPHSSFERVSENIRRMPANARPRAKDAAHQAAAADRGLSGACRAVFTFLLDDLYWVTGVSDRNGRLDLCSKTGFDRSTITRAIAKLRDRGHVLVQQKNGAVQPNTSGTPTRFLTWRQLRAQRRRASKPT